jgi:hypothetical protein
LTEEYSGTTNVPKEDDLRQGTCCIKMQIAPFHPEESGLRIYYPHKNSVSFRLCCGSINIVVDAMGKLN